MSLVNFRDRYQSTVSGTPGTGTITLGSAVTSYLPFVSGDNGLLFDILITDGTSWELAQACTYTYSGTTITRGTFLASSTGSILSLSSSAIVSVVLFAERTLPTTITSPTNGQVLTYSSTNGWINQNASSGSSSIPDYVSYTYAGGV